MSKKIIFSSGGTGGHIFPAINLMKHFSDKGYKVLLVTDNRGNNYLKKFTTFETKIIETETTTNKNFFVKIYSFKKIILSLIKCFSIIKKEKPHLIFGLGGYVSFPICFVSNFFSIPLIIYENNSILGRANKKLLPFAKKILLGKQVTKNINKKYNNKIFQVGNILNKDIINFLPVKKTISKNSFSVLVLGGSQGAEIFAKVIPNVIKMIKDNGYSIKINQQCVKNQKTFLTEFYNKNNIKNNIFDFSNDVLKLISESDLAISRCGSSTIAELIQTLTPFIAVPYPTSVDNHQYLNAKYYEEKGCCWLLDENNLNTTNLYNLIIDILEDNKKLENTITNMKKNDNKNVYTNVQKIVEEII